MAQAGTDGFTIGQEALGYNPFLPDVHTDPYSAYRRLREVDPVHHPFPGIWILSRHRDVAALLRDPRMSNDRRNSDLYKQFVESMPEPERFTVIPPSMLFLDPPDHTRLRTLVNKAFTPRTVEGLRVRVREIVTRLLDAAQEKGEIDVVADLAYPLPVTVICDLLGVGEEDRTQLRAWSLDLIYTLDPIITQDRMNRAEEALLSFRDYVHGLIAARRRTPGEDIVSALIASEEEGSRLTEEEIVSTCVLLLIAGHETTSSLIGTGTLALLRHPDQLRRLREDPGLIRTAIEELLRYDGPVQLTGRIALEDMEIDGHRIGKGEDVIGLTGSANRDPVVFDEPDRLDIGRPRNPHVAFGGGIHFCLGAPLARMEGQIAIRELIGRLPTLELATDEVEWRDTVTLRALTALPARF